MTETIFNNISIDRSVVKWSDYMFNLTPVEKVGKTYFKREDKFAPLGYGGINGSKLRQCIWLVDEYVKNSENPVGIMSRLYRKPDQIIQPWQFGHGETKATCLWLKNLPKLVPTNVVSGRENKVHRMSPGPDRWKERSRTYTGIAEAMADQWG